MERPTIHFAPEKNWMNDPNGTIFADGIYHLFYQYNPEGSDWGNIQWAYATSKNLVDWDRKGLKLTPESSIGERYCFSGCSVRTQNGFKLYYTSIGYEEDAVQHHARQLICDADTDFGTIRRNGHEITADIHGFSVSEWRDPFVFEFKGVQYMVLAGISDCGHIFLYRATDGEMNDWEYVGVLFTPYAPDDIPECPNVAVFGDKILIFYSLAKQNIVKYAVGGFDGKRFCVSGEGVVDYGVNCYYATNLTYGQGGDVVLFGWEKESLVGTSSVDGTYSGCLAVPRIVRLIGDRPEFYFTNSLLSLYKRELAVEAEDGKAVCRSNAVRTRTTFVVRGEAEVRILDSGEESVTLCFSPDALRIVRASHTKEADERVLEMPLTGESHHAEIVSDGTITEMLVDNAAVSFRFYRQNPLKTVFRQLGGDVSDVKVIELNGSEVR